MLVICIFTMGLSWAIGVTLGIRLTEKVELEHPSSLPKVGGYVHIHSQKMEILCQDLYTLTPYNFCVFGRG